MQSEAVKPMRKKTERNNRLWEFIRANPDMPLTAVAGRFHLSPSRVCKLAKQFREKNTTGGVDPGVLQEICDECPYKLESLH